MNIIPSIINIIKNVLIFCKFLLRKVFDLYDINILLNIIINIFLLQMYSYFYHLLEGVVLHILHDSFVYMCNDSNIF